VMPMFSSESVIFSFSFTFRKW